ncbi:hypothetical protein J6590_102105 [Homalodisca vitripennis]|nr:hypothetical protein J6590_102105 [Homalodisca vitripennis]
MLGAKIQKRPSLTTFLYLLLHDSGIPTVITVHCSVSSTRESTAVQQYSNILLQHLSAVDGHEHTPTARKRRRGLDFSDARQNSHTHRPLIGNRQCKTHRNAGRALIANAIVGCTVPPHTVICALSLIVIRYANCNDKASNVSSSEDNDQKVRGPLCRLESETETGAATDAARRAAQDFERSGDENAPGESRTWPADKQPSRLGNTNINKNETQHTVARSSGGPSLGD